MSSVSRFFSALVVVIILASFSWLSVPEVKAAGASLFLSPSSGVFNSGSNFSVTIKVSTGLTAINAIEGSVIFDPKYLKIVSFSKNNSILTLWANEPNFSNSEGNFSFAGGLPSPGFIGSTGTVLKINFQAKNSGNAVVSFVSSSVLANDGQGSNILSLTGSGNYTIKEKTAVSPSAIPLISPSTSPSVSPLASPFSEPEVKSLPAPIIILSTTLQEGDPLIIKGITEPEVEVTIWLQSENGQTINYKTRSSVDRTFIFSPEKKLNEGVYLVWAEAIDKQGVKTVPSEKERLTIKGALFFSIRFQDISPWPLFVVMLLVILLLLALLIYGWSRSIFFRKKINKETFEAKEVLHKTIDLLKDDVAEQIHLLEKVKSSRELSEEEHKIVRQLKRDLEAAEKLVKKEIKDITDAKLE